MREPGRHRPYLGAASLAGYLGGALCARPLARRGGAPRVLRAMMALVTVAFFACALPLSFTWFLLWRFASGVAGGAVMVLAAPTMLPHVPPARRGLAGGAIFTGVGLGIMASGTVVALLLQADLVTTWCGLGLLSLLLTALAWGGWPADDARAATTTPGPARRVAGGGALLALYFVYALEPRGGRGRPRHRAARPRARAGAGAAAAALTLALALDLGARLAGRKPI